MAKAEKMIVTAGPERGRRVVKRWSEVLPSRLSESEIWDAARHAAELVVLYARVEEEKKHITREFGTRLKTIRKETEEESRHVTTGMVDRDVDMEEVYDIAEDVVYRIRADTGEVVGKARKPTDPERQESFEFGTAS